MLLLCCLKKQAHHAGQRQRRAGRRCSLWRRTGLVGRSGPSAPRGALPSRLAGGTPCCSTGKYSPCNLIAVAPADRVHILVRHWHSRSAIDHLPNVGQRALYFTERLLLWGIFWSSYRDDLDRPMHTSSLCTESLLVVQPDAEWGDRQHQPARQLPDHQGREVERHQVDPCGALWRLLRVCSGKVVGSLP